MKELMQISQAVIDALSEAGVQAMAAFPPERVKQYDGAVAAVSVGTAEGKAVGFCNYLGQVWDEEAGTVEEFIRVFAARRDALLPAVCQLGRREEKTVFSDGEYLI